MPFKTSALRISGRRTRELAHGDDCPLQPLDGLARQRRDRKRMVIRSADGEARSVRAIGRVQARCGVQRSNVACNPVLGCDG
ncbi:MAG: hypothetical protein FJZ79_09555 [Chlorobi bacterium]|nr:hypothetical protein [Chlorobiota bacterium]